jgi:hypothetical protein
MAIDLKNLIDQVLEMARESLDLRKRNAEASWYGGNKDEEEYWKEMRRRNTELELRRAEGKNRLAEREMINTGDLEKQRVADAGELARKQLDLDFDKYKLGRDIDVDIYKTETDRYLKQQELAGKGDNKAKEIEAITGALSLTDLPEQTRKALTGRLNSIYSETPAPAAVPAAVPAAPAEVKVGPLDFDKPDEVPGTKSAGRQSMEFRAPGSIDPAAAAAAKKKSEERLLYGTKPQRRSWF